MVSVAVLVSPPASEGASCSSVRSTRSALVSTSTLGVLILTLSAGSRMPVIHCVQKCAGYSSLRTGMEMYNIPVLAILLGPSARRLSSEARDRIRHVVTVHSSTETSSLRTEQKPTNQPTNKSIIFQETITSHSMYLLSKVCFLQLVLPYLRTKRCIALTHLFLPQ